MNIPSHWSLYSSALPADSSSSNPPQSSWQHFGGLWQRNPLPLDQIMRDFSQCAQVHIIIDNSAKSLELKAWPHTDMCNEHVSNICGFATDFSIKVQSTRLNATLFNDSLRRKVKRPQWAGGGGHIVIDLLTFMTMVQALMSIGNWSVSQPRSGDPVLESMDPSILNLIGRDTRKT